MAPLAAKFVTLDPTGAVGLGTRDALTTGGEEYADLLDKDESWEDWEEFELSLVRRLFGSEPREIDERLNGDGSRPLWGNVKAEIWMGSWTTKPRNSVSKCPKWEYMRGSLG